MAILDRAGIGPHSSQEMSLSTASLVEQWAAEPEARGDLSELESDSA